MYMKKIKPTSKYQTVSFPEPFYKEIKEYVEKNPRYRSIAEFVKEAVRLKIAMDKQMAYEERKKHVPGIGTSEFPPILPFGSYPYQKKSEPSIEEVTKVVVSVMNEMKKKKKIV